MQRRQCLQRWAVWACGVALPGASHAQLVLDSAHFGKPWRVPAGLALQLRPATWNLTLVQALQAVQEWHIPFDARVIIQLDDAEHPQTQAIRWQLLHGARVSVQGNQAEPERCRLIFRHSGDGFYVGAGQVLGGLSGVTLVQADSGQPGSGVLADEGGVAHCSASVRIRNFYYGVQARRNGVARCEGVHCSGGGDANFFAFMGGHIHARRAYAAHARDEPRKLGSGFVAEYGGSIDAAGAQADFNFLDGFTALSNGVIRAYQARASRNGRSGFFTDTGGRIVGHDAVATENCGEGLLSRDGDRAITGSRMQLKDNSAPAASCRSGQVGQTGQTDPKGQANPTSSERR